MKRTIALSAISLCACAASSGVLKMGPDTYTITVAASPARGGVAGAKQMGFDEAGKYCTGLGKEILVTNIKSATTNYAGAGNIDMTFRCLAQGDPDLRRPEYRPEATTVIEDQRSK